MEMATALQEELDQAQAALVAKEASLQSAAGMAVDELDRGMAAAQKLAEEAERRAEAERAAKEAALQRVAKLEAQFEELALEYE